MGKRKYAPKSKTFDIQPGMRGLFVTCFRDQEARCTSEMMQLLDRVTEEDVSSVNETLSSGTTNFADSIAAEVAGLRTSNTHGYQAQSIGGLSCIVFVKTACDPLQLAQKLFSKTDHGYAVNAARFCQRIIPISVICHANLEDLRREASHLISTSFDQPRTYCVVFESRFSHSMDRKMTIDLLADMVGSRHRVDLGDPELVIMVQVFMNLCGISIIPSYQQFKKYNIQEFYKANAPR